MLSCFTVSVNVGAFMQCGQLAIELTNSALNPLSVVLLHMCATMATPTPRSRSLLQSTDDRASKGVSLPGGRPPKVCSKYFAFLPRRTVRLTKGEDLCVAKAQCLIVAGNSRTLCIGQVVKQPHWSRSGRSVVINHALNVAFKLSSVR
jgi:hypothetical protein